MCTWTFSGMKSFSRVNDKQNNLLVWPDGFSEISPNIDEK